MPLNHEGTKEHKNKEIIIIPLVKFGALVFLWQVFDIFSGKLVIGKFFGKK